MKIGGLRRRDAPSKDHLRSETSRDVMEDAKPPENAFRDALVAFAEKYAV
jgi:hypothetical protein